jgi:nucleoside-diphosphate-sugar epimerase
MAELRRRGVDAVACSRRDDAGNIVCDLMQPGAISALVERLRPCTVIHLAANVPKDPSSYADQNGALADLTMVENLVAAKPDRVIFASSMTVYNSTQRMPVRESDASASESAYGTSKLKAEHCLLARLANVICLRLPGLFGAGRPTGLIHNAIKAYSAGLPFVPSAPPPLWSAMHVEDAAGRCIDAAMRSEPFHGPINIGHCEQMSIPAALNQLASLFSMAGSAVSDAPIFQIDCSRQHAVFDRALPPFADRLRDAAIEAGVAI